MEMQLTSSTAAPVDGEEEDLTVDEGADAIQEALLPPWREPSKKQSYEESLLNILQEKKGQETDQETNFALSLVPMLKALPMDKKIEAQFQILQIFKMLNSQPGRSGS